MVRALLIGFLLLQSIAVLSQAPAGSSRSTLTTPATASNLVVLAANCVPTRPSPDSDGVTTRRPGEALGDQLAKSDGTLCPPSGVDAEIRTVRPEAGASKMPVIPPPGSPGGDPNVRPK